MEKLRVVHVTTLWQYNWCPYLWNSTKDNPIDPKMTMKWDMLNMVVNGKWDYQPFLNRYWENIAYDFKQIEIYKKILAKARQRKIDLYEQFEEVFQECKMMIPYNDNTRIVWTPDVFFYDKELDLWKIRDWKLSTFSWYGNEEVTKYDMQWPIYSLMVMNMYKVDRCEFKYWVFDKNNWNFWQFGKIYTRTECESTVKDVMDRYLNSLEWDDYPCRANNKCKGMCDINKRWECPLFKREVKLVEDDNEF